MNNLSQVLFQLSRAFVDGIINLFQDAAKGDLWHFHSVAVQLMTHGGNFLGEFPERLRRKCSVVDPGAS